MSRYIDADKVTEAFVKAAKQVGNIGDQIAFRMMINEIPTADVRENVRGKWIDGTPYVNSHWMVCSVCHKSAHESCGGDNYCPNCGAQMVEYDE